MIEATREVIVREYLDARRLDAFDPRDDQAAFAEGLARGLRLAKEERK